MIGAFQKNDATTVNSNFFLLKFTSVNIYVNFFFKFAY